MATYILSDIVREIAGDTDSIVSRELVNYFLAEAGNNVYAAAQKIALVLASRYANSVDAKVGDVQVKGGSAQVSDFLKISAAMRMQVVLTTVSPDAEGIYAGGISIADKEVRESESDRAEPFFTREGNLVVGATNLPTVEEVL